DLDGGVVDTHATQRGKHMFDSGNQRAFLIAQHGCKFGGDHGIGGGLNLAVAVCKSGPHKNKTRIHGCRSDRQTDSRTTMNAHTGDGGLRAKRCLSAKFHTKTAHYDLPKTRSARSPHELCAESHFRYPQVAATISFAPKSANSRFFTDCYPISAVFAPKLKQI